MSTAPEDRPPITHDVHTAELPPLPQRDSLIPAERWVEAPPELRALGEDFGVRLVAYKRRINQFLLWRAGPAAGADSCYMALDADSLDRRFTFRLHPDGSGEGFGPDGVRHTRFRSWKEALRDAGPAGSGDSAGEPSDAAGVPWSE